MWRLLGHRPAVQAAQSEPLDRYSCSWRISRTVVLPLVSEKYRDLAKSNRRKATTYLCGGWISSSSSTTWHGKPACEQDVCKTEPHNTHLRCALSYAVSVPTTEGRNLRTALASAGPRGTPAAQARRGRTLESLCSIQLTEGAAEVMVSHHEGMEVCRHGCRVVRNARCRRPHYWGGGVRNRPSLALEGH